jgi:hypothetical protein
MKLSVSSSTQAPVQPERLGQNDRLGAKHIGSAPGHLREARADVDDPLLGAVERARLVGEDGDPRRIAADLGEQRFDAVPQLPHHAGRFAIIKIDVLVIGHREISNMPCSRPAGR